MSNTLARVYDRFADAENAREALLGAGFPAADVHLVSKDDEAGPVEGNFMVGNTAVRNRGIRGWIEALTGGDDHTYRHDYVRAVQRGSYLLTVDAEDAEQRDRAADIMHRFGGHDADMHDAGAGPPR